MKWRFLLVPGAAAFALALSLGGADVSANPTCKNAGGGSSNDCDVSVNANEAGGGSQTIESNNRAVLSENDLEQTISASAQFNNNGTADTGNINNSDVQRDAAGANVAVVNTGFLNNNAAQSAVAAAADITF